MVTTIMKRTSLAVAGLLVVGVSVASAQKLNPCGASFPQAIYEKWFADYHTAHPGVQISYNPNGSGGGITGLTNGTCDFGASDAPMSDAELSAANASRGKVLHFPTVMGAVVPIYNIPGVTQDLRFSGPVLADIYLGKITKWNDKAIAADNPGVKLPNEDIIPVHRTDASGTTFIFTDFLSNVSPEWKQKVGAAKAVNWPGQALGGAQNPGVTGVVKQTPNSIGYVELIYAIKEKLAYGLIKNAAGAFVKGSMEGVTEAAAGAAAHMPDDFRVSIVNAPGKTSYPISSFTWMLIPAKMDDAAKAAAVKAFLQWMLTEGQKTAPTLYFAALPKNVVTKEVAQLNQLEAPSGPAGKKR